MDQVEVLATRGDYAAAEKLIAELLPTVKPDVDEDSQYYELRVSQMLLWDTQGQYDRTAAAYRQWIRETSSEIIASDFATWCGQYDRVEDFRAMIEELNKAGPADNAALVRLRVSALGGWIAKGIKDLHALEEAMREVAKLIDPQKTPRSRLAMLNLTLAPERDTGLSEVRFDRLIARVMGSKADDVNFLLNWVVSENVHGSPDSAREVLSRAKPLLKPDDADSQARWLYSSARNYYLVNDLEAASAELERLKALCQEKHDTYAKANHYFEQVELMESTIRTKLSGGVVIEGSTPRE